MVTSSLNDAKIAYLISAGYSGSLDDMLYNYWASTSGLTPQAKYSTGDHERTVLLATVSGAAATMSLDTLRSLQRNGQTALAYWSTLTVAPPYTDPTGNFLNADASTAESSSATATTANFGNTVNAVLARQTTKASEGSAGWQLTHDASATTTMNQQLGKSGTTGYRVIAGNTYTAMVNTQYATTAKNCHMDFDWYDSSGTALTATTGTASASSTTAFVTFLTTAVAPTNAMYGRPRITMIVGTGSSEVCYFDKCGMFAGTKVASDWVAGA